MLQIHHNHEQDKANNTAHSLHANRYGRIIVTFGNFIPDAFGNFITSACFITIVTVSVNVK